MAKKVRIGVVGVGGMGQGHCDYLGPGKLDVAELTAVCDIVPAVAKQVGEKWGVPHFSKHTDLLDSGLVDAILIATPHYFHPPIAIDAFKRKIHVLSEKPIGVTIKPVNQMIRAAEKSGCKFAVMFQLRHKPEYQAAKKLIESGRIGELRRVNMIIAYYRSQAYYNSGGWRATWKGEGGGVLLNQAPHMLDIFTWLTGRPKTVTGQTRIRMHDIEVEDEAFASLEYPNGAHGYIYAGVNDTPQCTRLEICGDKGKILIESRGWDKESLHVWEVIPPLSKFTVENKSMWASPKAELIEVPMQEREQGHIAVTRNFCNAILRNEPLVTPGAEGIYSLELADAMILSSYRKKPAKLPLNANEYEELMAELVRKSKTKKAVTEQRITDTAFVEKKPAKKKVAKKK
jgi:predicted dehydrogenase